MNYCGFLDANYINFISCLGSTIHARRRKYHPKGEEGNRTNQKGRWNAAPPPPPKRRRRRGRRPSPSSSGGGGGSSTSLTDEERAAPLQRRLETSTTHKNVCETSTTQMETAAPHRRVGTQLRRKWRGDDHFVLFIDFRLLCYICFTLPHVTLPCRTLPYPTLPYAFGLRLSTLDRFPVTYVLLLSDL